MWKRWMLHSDSVDVLRKLKKKFEKMKQSIGTVMGEDPTRCKSFFVSELKNSVQEQCLT